ncbi:GxxExxY protein [Lacibacter luteus]|uniref:GxxExxY protein n=1 Tax=Lacibacter luteus TaxID=2508719 RepID=A0A4Q1CNC7_9BACT|nr:GxxExxY protein [Lacibacter luteus]RXK62593.1 GxxExxY protein [Lacibacter luteus]
MDINDLTYKIRGSIFQVHNTLGPGLFESVYEAALAYELVQQGLQIRTQVGIPVSYKEVHLEMGFRLDILVEGLVIVEIKSVEKLMDVHKKQLLTYLKLTNTKIGLLVNFNAANLFDRENLIRIIN